MHLNRTKIILLAGFLIVPIVLYIAFTLSNSQLENSIIPEQTIKGMNLDIDQIGQSWSLKKTKEDSKRDIFSLSENLNNKPVPTNTWWNAALYSDINDPFYVIPYSIKIDNGKIEFSNIPKNTTDKLVLKPHVAEFFLEIPNIASKELESYDDFSFALNLLDSINNKVGTSRIIKGSPYSFYSIDSEQIRIRTLIGFSEITQIDNQNLMIDTKENLYLFTSKDIKEFTNFSNNALIQFNQPTGNEFTVTLIKNNRNLEVFTRNALNKVTGTKVSYSIEADKINITMKLSTENNDLSIMGLIPSQSRSTNAKSFKEIDSLRGTVKFYETNEITYSIKIPSKIEQFHVSNLIDTDITKLTELWEKDIKDVKFMNTGTYFAGKDLFRVSNLVDVADILDKNTGSSKKTELLSILEKELINWFTYDTTETSKYFEYDQARGGIIGIMGEFDSQNYNDHHFHYGYFIYSFATVCKYNLDFCNKYSGIVNLLIKDIANNDSNDNAFPYMRVFDQFEGHSWASGISTALDGNNQESVSEAINAWYAIWKLGEVTNNDKYKELGTFLYSMEVNSAQNYWWNTYQDTSIFGSKYEYDYASLIWGGKFEVNTFFSNRPEATLSIIILPVSGGSLYLKDKPHATRVLDHLNRLIGQNYILFEDVINQYKMINGFNYKPVSDLKLDPINSYSYTYLQSLYFKQNP